MTRCHITLSQLIELKACKSQVELFEKTFGDKVEVTLENAKTFGHLFDINWAVEKFLKAPALAEYQKVQATALAEYQKSTSPALAEYEKVLALALAEYQKVKAFALAEYRKATSSAFVQLYLKQEALNSN